MRSRSTSGSCELLADAGLDPTDAARASYLLIVYVFGSIALEVADVHQARPAAAGVGPDGRPAARLRRRRRPTTSRAARRRQTTMAGYISTEQYLWGLRRILDGITARAASTRTPPHRCDGQVTERHRRRRAEPP